MPRILIIGLGSIGSRHLSLLLKRHDIELAALRTSKGVLKEKFRVKEFYNVQEALNFNPQGVIVANPTALHVNSAKPFLERGAKVLIEKPLASSVVQGIELKDFSDQIRVAYCLRFHPFYSTLKNALRDNMGRVFKVTFNRSFYLPFWHPYADYRIEYTAQKRLGGGVVRTLSHEIDMMLYLFGEINSVAGYTDKISELELDEVDDDALIICKMKSGCRVNLSMDFLSPENENYLKLNTENGRYCADLSKGISSFTDYHGNMSNWIEIPENAVEVMYQKQMEDFLAFIDFNKSFNADFNSALNVLQIIEQVDQF